MKQNFNQKLESILSQQAQNIQVFKVVETNVKIQENMQDGRLFRSFEKKKQLNLKQLTKQFLQLLLEQQKQKIIQSKVNPKQVEQCYSLFDIAKKLSVPKRKLYDIINVLQTIRLVEKIQGNFFYYNGSDQFIQLIENLQQGKEEICEDQFNYQNRFKQLGVLAQGFLMKLLKSDEQNVIILNEISNQIVLQNANQNQVNTRLRRLYDLANIFQVLGIIKKVKNNKSKPGYIWQGVQGFNQMLANFNESEKEKQIIQSNKPKQSDDDIYIHKKCKNSSSNQNYTPTTQDVLTPLLTKRKNYCQIQLQKKHQYQFETEQAEKECKQKNQDNIIQTQQQLNKLLQQLCKKQQLLIDIQSLQKNDGTKSYQQSQQTLSQQRQVDQSSSYKKKTIILQKEGQQIINISQFKVKEQAKQNVIINEEQTDKQIQQQKIKSQYHKLLSVKSQFQYQSKSQQKTMQSFLQSNQ